MRLVKTAKAFPRAKFYNLSTATSIPITVLRQIYMIKRRSGAISWLANNKLIVNTAKTKYMIFSPKSHNMKIICKPGIQLKLVIKWIDSFKFLGVIVSENLQKILKVSKNALCSKQTPRLPGTNL